MKIPRYKLFLAIFDLFILLISLILSYEITLMYNNSKFSEFVSYWSILNIWLIITLLLIPALFIFLFQDNDLYKVNIFLNRSLHIVSLVKSYFYGVLFLVFYSFLIKYPFIRDSRFFVICFALISIIFFFFFRVLLLRKIFQKFWENNLFKRNVVIIGAGKSGKLMASKIMVENNLGLNFVGFVDDNSELDKKILDTKKLLGTVNDLGNIIKYTKVNEVILAIDNISYNRLLEILDICNKLNLFVRVNSELFEIIPSKVGSENYDKIPVVDFTSKISKRFTIAIKRFFDVIFSAIALIILTPIFLVTFLAIKFSSKEPVFYIQKRIGKNGKLFDFYKFRTMTLLDGEDHGRKQKMLNFMRDKNEKGKKVIDESRVTKIGSFLRKYSLDELPQLINVLKGDMSLVGPRPCLPYEYEHYDEWHKRRLRVLPGCTGVWQVYGRSSVSFKDSVVLDIYYTQNMSPWLDLQLMIKTIPIMLSGKGGA